MHVKTTTPQEEAERVTLKAESIGDAQFIRAVLKCLADGGTIRACPANWEAVTIIRKAP